MLSVIFAVIFPQVNDAKNFAEHLSINPWSTRVSYRCIGGDDYSTRINQSSALIKLSLKEEQVIVITVAPNYLEQIKNLIETCNGNYVPQDEYMKWRLK
ncbi:MAG: hypothetical protein F6K14_04845 [Symploca sp. SIO2C1]|nr:hypothetical protein [Symploca sp. SIO2C1]